MLWHLRDDARVNGQENKTGMFRWCSFPFNVVCTDSCQARCTYQFLVLNKYVTYNRNYLADPGSSLTPWVHTHARRVLLPNSSRHVANHNLKLYNFKLYPAIGHSVTSAHIWLYFKRQLRTRCGGHSYRKLVSTLDHDVGGFFRESCPWWVPAASFAWFCILIVLLYPFIQFLRRPGGAAFPTSMVEQFVGKQNLGPLLKNDSKITWFGGGGRLVVQINSPGPLRNHRFHIKVANRVITIHLATSAIRLGLQNQERKKQKRDEILARASMTFVRALFV